MTKKSLMPTDKFTVINRTTLHDNDRKNLTLLYQPIIGPVATNLYFTLWSLLDRNECSSIEYQHKILTSFTSTSISELEQARTKLEAVGLLKTLRKDDNNNISYIYQLFSVLPPSEFFKNIIFSNALYSVLGKEAFEIAKSFFKLSLKSNDGYIDITCLFDDIYQFGQVVDQKNEQIIERNYQKLGIRSTIDIDRVISLVPEILERHIIISDFTQELIIKLAFTYSFNESTVIQLISKSITDKNYIDPKFLQENFKSYYLFENNNKIPGILNRTQPENLRKDIKSDTKINRIIYMYESTPPINFLCRKNNNNKLTANELSIIQHLLVDVGLTPGVVNVLLDFVLKTQDNRLVKAYISTIGTTWKRNNIERVEEAMEEAKKAFNSQKQKVEKQVGPKTIIVNSNAKKEENKPSWMNESIEENYDEEKAKEMEKLLKEV